MPAGDVMRGGTVLAQLKPINSYKDSRGMVVVACCECNRGGNGQDKDKCSAGWQVKRGGDRGCFSGELLEKYDQAQVISWDDHVRQEKIKRLRRASR